MIQKEVEAHWARLCAQEGLKAAAVAVRRVERDADEELLLSLSPAQRAVYSGFGASERQRQWAEARRCERELRDRLGPGVLTSVSHTGASGDSWVVAVGGVSSAPRGGVGVDLEPAARVIDERIRSRLLTSREAVFEGKLSLLEFWVIKEACFKANPLNPGTLLPEYEVQRFGMDGAGKARFRKDKTSVELSFSIAREGEWLLAFAVSVSGSGTQGSPLEGFLDQS